MPHHPNFRSITAEQVARMLTEAHDRMGAESIDHSAESWTHHLGINPLAQVTGIADPVWLPVTEIVRLEFYSERLTTVVNRWHELIHAAGVDIGPFDLFFGLLTYLAKHSELANEGQEDDFMRTGSATLFMMDEHEDFWTGWTAMQLALVTDHLNGAQR